MKNKYIHINTIVIVILYFYLVNYLLLDNKLNLFYQLILGGLLLIRLVFRVYLYKNFKSLTFKQKFMLPFDKVITSETPSFIKYKKYVTENDDTEGIKFVKIFNVVYKLSLFNTVSMYTSLLLALFHIQSNMVIRLIIFSLILISFSIEVIFGIKYSKLVLKLVEEDSIS